ncbi:hypothetical protein [Paenibacillus faecalis]|uniref:hypothetical protein n=1 Tax=Paenibacillus faecalis TaxID=2079532 RepID=UPI000D10BF58|nr:hypothetical protein [Paenibacillus faecalis]
MKIINNKKALWISIAALFMGTVFIWGFSWSNQKYEPKTYTFNSYSDYAMSGNIQGLVENKSEWRLLTRKFKERHDYHPVINDRQYRQLRNGTS